MLRFVVQDAEREREHGGEKDDVASVEHDRPAHSVVVDFPKTAPTFQWEQFSSLAHELPPLFVRHLEEFAAFKKHAPPDINWQALFALEFSNLLLCLTCRHGGKLVGYHFIVRVPSITHASTPLAASNMLWLAPEFRQGWTGYKLLREAKKFLAANGIKMHELSLKLAARRNRQKMRPMLKRLGYRATDVVYTGHLG